MEISVGADLESVYKPEVGNKERSSWLGNGEGDETKLKRKELGVSGFDDLTKSKKVRHSTDDDDTQVDSRSSSGFGQKTNGGIGADGHAVLIPKRPRGAGGRSKFAKGHLLNPSASLEKPHDQKEVSGSGHSSVPAPVKLNGVKSRKKDKGVVGSKGNKKQGSTAVASGRHAKSGGDLVESLFSKDEVAQLKGVIKFPGAADNAPLSSSSLGSKDDVAKLKKQENPQNKDDQMDKLKGKFKIMEIDGKQRHTEDPAVVGSFLLAKGEGTDVAMTSKRNGGNRMKRKRLGSNGETVSKKVAASSSVDLDPDDDLEQNAARMLSSRFDPSCTGFASESATLGLLSVNEGEQEKHTGSQGPMTASAEAQDRVLRPRRHKKGKGTSRKRRHFYEIHSDDMDAHWFLNRKIKIFWPLDESWYYGLVNDYDAEKNLHHIKYEDRDEEWISLGSERFKLLLLPSELPSKANSLNYTTPSEESSLVHMKDDGFLESEPIISWLAHHRVKSSTATCLRKQKFSRDVCSMMERETDKLNCTSVLFNTSVEDNNGSEEGHVPIVYVRRRRYHRFSDAEAAASPWPLNNATAVLKLDTTQPIMQRDKFEICIPLWPMLTYSILGADILWLFRSVFLLQFGTLVTMWPTVFLEVLFVDNIVGLRLFLFEGCLKQAVAFIFLVMNVFYEPEKDEPINHQVPVTSIRFKLSFFQNFKNHKVFAYFSFSKVRDFDWQYLDSVFKPHCLLSKYLSLSECTYDNIKLLQGVPQTKHIPYAVQTEVFHKKSNGGGGSLLSSSRSLKRVPGIRTIYGLRHGNVPPFALSFTASPNLFISLHLKLLLERSISLAAADDGDDDEDFSQFEISSESSSSKGSSHDAAIDGREIESSTFVSDSNFNEAAGNSQENNRPSRQFNDPHTSNLKGIISVEIPASNEVYRPQQHQMSDLTWNLSDGIICSPNQHSTGPKTSLWHHRKPWGDGKTEIFGNGPKKPRTQVQYTLPYSNKNKGHNNLPYQRIRKTNDKKISDTKGGGPKRNLELVTCDANILINGGDKGWRECGARVFLEADQQKEWKLAVKCSGELRYAYKVHQDLQPGSTNRYTHAMMWKGGKDWALEFPERSQWFVFKELHEECHNRNIRAASIKNIPIPGVRLIQVVDHPHQKEECFTRTPWYLRQVRDDVEMAMDASRVMYDMDSDDEEWVCRSRSKEGSNGHAIISDELFEKVMDMLEKVSYAQKRDHFSSGEIDELIARVTPMQAAKSIYDHWREKRQRKGMPLVRQLQSPLWERYQQICREWEKLKPKSTTGPGSGSQEKASAAAGDKPPMFAFCLKPRGLEVLNKGSKHRPHKKISLSGHSLGDHDAHHSGRRVHTYGFGDERADSSDVSPLLVTKMYSPRDTGHFWLDGGDASDHQLRIQSSKSSIRTLVSPKLGPSAALRKSSSVKRNNSKKFSDWHHNRVQQQQLVLGGSDLDEFRLRDASSAAKHARNMAKLKRERAQKLMLSADLAIHKAVSALMTAEAIKASCTGGDNESTSPPSSVS